MHPGWVGNGWNLSAGGVISRTVKDVPDDYSNGNYYLGANMGFYFNHNVLATSNWNQIPYMQSIAENDAMLADTEPDEFSFNFGDYSGAFFLDHNGNWQVKSNKALKVTYNGNFLDNPFTPPYGTRMQMYGSSKTFGGFTITTDDGTQYVFGGVTDAIEYGIGIFNQDMSEWVANSWYLTKIIDVNGNETDFTYQRDDYISQMYISVVNDVGTRVTNSGGFLQPSCSSWSYSSIGASYGGQLISPVYLQQISTPNAVVKLNRSTSTELRYSQAVYDWSYYMWSMNGGGVYGVDFLPILSNYGMNYYPQCLDLLQWKKLDEIRIEKPDGTLLKSINFNYNNNANERLTLLSITEQGSNGVSKPPFTFYYDTSKPLPGYLANMTDHWGFYNGTYADISNQSNYYNTYFGYRQPNADFLLAGTLTSIVYPTGGITSFVFEPNDYSQQVNLDRSLYPQTFSSNQLCGGLRVKKITSYDVQSPQQKIVKEYYYVQNYNSSVNASGLLSSGVLGGRIKYYFDDYRVRAFNDNGVVYSKSLFSSQSVLPGCVNAQGSHIGYSQVVEKMADNSYKIFHYSNYDTGNTDEGADNNLQVSRTEYEPYSSNEESRGKLLLEEDFDSNNHIVSSHQVQYVAFNKQTSFVRAMKARYFNVCPGGATSAEEGTAYKLYYYSYLPVSETNTIFDQLGNAVNSARSYTYNNLKLMYTQTATNSLGKQEITTYNYPADIAPIAGSSSPYAGMVAKNMQSQVITEYKSVAQNGSYIGDIYKKRYNYSELFPGRFLMTSYDFSSGTGTPLESRALAGYDIMGNQVFSTRVSGPSTCYIWSYQGQYLVAKIENANYTDVVSVLGGSYAIDQFRIRANPTDLEVNSFLLPLRTIANAHVTTYTYQPLIGMTSSTDPKGQTVYYEYDDFQRLMTMKDQDRKILNFTDYHYKQ